MQLNYIDINQANVIDKITSNVLYSESKHNQYVHLNSKQKY